MGWISRVFGSPVVAHAQSLADKGSEVGFDVDIPAEVFGLPSYGSPVAPVAKVDRKTALSVPAFSRGRDMIAGTIGTIPLDLYGPDKRVRDSRLLEQPEMGLASMVTITRTVEDLICENYALWLVKERDGYDFPAKVERVDTSRIDYDPVRGVVKVDGNEVNALDCILFVGPATYGVLERGARAIRQAVLLDDLARKYAENPQPREYFVPGEGSDPQDEEVQLALNTWATARQTGVTGFVPGGLELKQGALINPRDLQLADARQHAVLEIARLLGIDPEDLGVSVTSRTYQNLEQSRRERVTNTLQPFISAVEQRLSMNDVTPRGSYVKFNLDSFLRSDTTTRYQSYATALGSGFLTLPEVRELEDRQPLEENTVNDSLAASKHELAGTFSDEPELAVMLDAPASDAEFQVDLEKRTIRGLAVPYDATAEKMGRIWQFSKGTLKWADLSRVKLLDGHDWSKPIGVAVKAEDTDKGLVMTFKVPATPAGDEALLLASEKVKDGLSVGIGVGGTFDEKGGILHAVSAPLAHVALTPCPAFDSARVTAVAASKDNQGETMADKVDTPATGESVAPQFTTDEMAALKALLAPKEEAPKPEPQKVPQFSVNEDLPYRFDGLRGEHEFSSDLFSVARHLPGSGEAQARLDKFMDVAFAVTVSGVSALNPSPTRADLFVDNLEYAYPVWNAINKGTLADGTPFIAPKFSSASGLVGDHVEGTAPTAGSYAATSQTITPSATSGRVEVPREVVDAGGNPQVSGMIWREVVRAYYENLEAKAVALLDGLTPTAIAITPAGAADDVLAAQIEAAFASLHFLRGGDRFDKLVLQEDLYKALIGARDADGRVLYPVINPTNANGSVAANLGQILIGGKVGLPAWALGASGAVSESSYLFASEDVHGWATPPKRFDFEYRVEYVDLAVWGYKATANTRLAGVREITYDPVA